MSEKHVVFTSQEQAAIELALRFLCHNLRRCSLTGMYYLPSDAGMACSSEQATAI